MRSRLGWIALLVVVPALAGWGLRGWLRPKPSLGAAEALLDEGRWREAEPRVRAFRNVAPDDPRGVILWARVERDKLDHLDQPDRASARAAVDRLRRVQPSDKRLAARARCLEGELCYRLELFDQAETALKTALDLDPTATDAGWLLIQIYERQGRQTENRQLALRLLRVYSTRSERLRALKELVHQEVHRPAAASLITILEPMVQANPRDFSSTLALGRFLVREGRTEDGLQFLHAAVAAFPESIDAWDALLSGLEDAGRIDELVRALARAPRSPESVARLARHEGWAAQERGAWEAAADAYRRALAAGSDDLRLPYRLSRVLRLGGQVDEAARRERALRDFEAARGALRALFERSDAAFQDGRPHPALWQEFADLRERMGRRDEARAWHALVLRDRPNDPVSLAAIDRLKGKAP